MPTTMIKLGGCNGSGKSSVARAILAQGTWKQLLHDGKVEGYRRNEDGLRILGRYETACGGMDAMGNKEQIRDIFHRHVAKPGIVLIEGLIVGKTYGYMGEQLYKLGQKNKARTLWAFMGESFDECAERVRRRRQERGDTKPFDPERTMRLTYTIMQRLEEGVRSGKYPIVGEVLRLSVGKSPKALAGALLKKAEAMHNG